MLQFQKAGKRTTCQLSCSLIQRVGMLWVAGGGGREGGRMFFVLFCFLLTRFDLQKGMLFKDINWQDRRRSQTGASLKKSLHSHECFITASLTKPMSSTYVEDVALLNRSLLILGLRVEKLSM